MTTWRLPTAKEAHVKTYPEFIITIPLPPDRPLTGEQKSLLVEKIHQLVREAVEEASPKKEADD